MNRLVTSRRKKLEQWSAKQWKYYQKRAKTAITDHLLFLVMFPLHCKSLNSKPSTEENKAKGKIMNQGDCTAGKGILCQA